MNYIDDLIYCALPSKIDKAYQFLLTLVGFGYHLLEMVGLEEGHQNRIFNPH